MREAGCPEIGACGRPRSRGLEVEIPPADVLLETPARIAALAFQGIAHIYGALSEDDTAIPVLEMIRKMTVVKGYSVRLVTGDADRRKAAVEYVNKGLASGALKSIIDRTFKFDEMVEVHRYLENSGQFGKIVVTL